MGILGVACNNTGGVPDVIQDFEQQDRVVEAEKERESEYRAAVAIRSTIQAKLGMSAEAAAALDVAVMPNAKMLAGAKDKATGLCFLVGSTEGAWTVFSMGTTIDAATIAAIGHGGYGDGKHGSTVDGVELKRWAQEHCTP